MRRRYLAQTMAFTAVPLIMAAACASGTDSNDGPGSPLGSAATTVDNSPSTEASLSAAGGAPGSAVSASVGTGSPLGTDTAGAQSNGSGGPSATVPLASVPLPGGPVEGQEPGTGGTQAIEPGAAGQAGGQAEPSTGGTGATEPGTGGAGATGPDSGGSGERLSLLTDTNRDGAIDENDTPNLTEWTWQGPGAFFIANVDDDDLDGQGDALDSTVNGLDDSLDLARVVVALGTDALAQGASVSVAITGGAADVHLFQNNAGSWEPIDGVLTPQDGELELGLEASRFADTDWNGLATLQVELRKDDQVLESRSVTLRVAPWLMLPGSAATELVYVIGDGTGNNMRAGIDAVLQSQGLPVCETPTPNGQDQWYQDTMEIGYTQLPGLDPMHVVMKAQRGMVDDVAEMLLSKDFGFISIGEPRELGNGFGGDWWMDWMGNLEVTPPVPGYPLGRIYYGQSAATTFHPTIVAFLEAQEVQAPFSIYTEWLVIQHVDETMTFVVDQTGKAYMVVPSAAAANDVLGSGYDADQERAQGFIDDIVATAKAELGITDAEILDLPLYFDGSGLDYSARWSDPVNSLFVNGTFIIGETNTPAAIKTDIENRLSNLGIEAAWVDDADYQYGGGNVHCGTNAAKTPVCANFADCL